MTATAIRRIQEPQYAERLRCFQAAGVYLVTSQAQSRGRTTLEIIRRALAGGIRLIQLREKEMTVAELMPLAEDARRLTADAGALLIVNDRVDMALAVDADGVHLGQTDFPIPAARRLAPDLIIGASTHTLEEALAAQAQGASYLNIGPLFPTRTKQDYTGAYLGVEGLRAIAPAVRIPFTIMGGIKREHVPALRQAGAQVIAVVSAITAADDPAAAARDLLAEWHGSRGA